MNRNNYRMNQYLKDNPKCEKCGEDIGCEVHHIIPIALGGIDNKSNYQTLCAKCHRMIHLQNRSELTKIWLAKARRKTASKLFSELDFYNALNEIVEEGWAPTLLEICDMVNSLPVKGYCEVE